MNGLDLDPSRTRVLLIGNDHFPADPDHLDALPAVRNNLQDLRTLVTDPELCGVPGERVTTVENGSSVAILRAVAETSRDAEDALLIYYAGHGLVDQGHLYLAAADSTERLIEFTGVDIEKFRQAVRASPASKRIVILDCCYSGRALGEMSGGAGAAVAAAIGDFAGSYVMTSAGATRAAQAPVGARLTLFTEHLIDVLRQGIDGAGPTLRLPVVFQAISRRLRALPGAPEPQQSVTQTLNMAGVFKNRSPKAVVETAESLSSIERRLAQLEAQNHELQAELDRQRRGSVDPEGLRAADAQLQAAARTLRHERELVRDNRLDEVDLDRAAASLTPLEDIVRDVGGWWRRYNARQVEKTKRQRWVYNWLIPLAANFLPFGLIDAAASPDELLGMLVATVAVVAVVYGLAGRQLGWSRLRVMLMVGLSSIVSVLLLLELVSMGAMM